jgi:hypothetical protein
MLTARLVLGQSCPVLVIAHQSILKALALFDRGSNRGSPDNESLALDASQSLEGFNL